MFYIRVELIHLGQTGMIELYLTTKQRNEEMAEFLFLSSMEYRKQFYRIEIEIVR